MLSVRFASNPESSFEDRAGSRDGDRMASASGTLLRKRNVQPTQPLALTRQGIKPLVYPSLYPITPSFSLLEAAIQASLSGLYISGAGHMCGFQERK